MGYVHVTDISQFISPFEFAYSVGTWTPTLSSYLITNVKTAAADNPKIMVPIPLPSSSLGLQAAKLVSLDVWYSISTAACTGFGLCTISKVILAATGVACTGAAIDSTMDAAHDTVQERYATGAHKMTCTVDTPFFMDKNYAYYFSMDITAAAGTVLAMIGAQANYTLRL